MAALVGDDFSVGIAKSERDLGQVVVVIAPDVERLGGGRQPHRTSPDLLFSIERKTFSAKAAIHINEKDFDMGGQGCCPGLVRLIHDAEALAFENSTWTSGV
jgi:hypothetical protein